MDQPIQIRVRLLFSLSSECIVYAVVNFSFLSGQINQSQSLFAYAENENVNTFAKPDFVPMFADNITWYNDSLRKAAEAQCGDDYECLFDAASTSDLSIGMTTKLISVQLVNESKVLGKRC